MDLCHQFFADNITVVIEVDEANIQVWRKAFDDFDNRSDLRCDWEHTSMIYISMEPILAEMQALTWKWEMEETFLKLLGIHFGVGISHDLTLTYIKEKLDDKLKKLKRDPYDFMFRVIIANQLMMGSFWYSITLWGERIRRCIVLR